MPTPVSTSDVAMAGTRARALTVGHESEGQAVKRLISAAQIGVNSVDGQPQEVIFLQCRQGKQASALSHCYECRLIAVFRHAKEWRTSSYQSLLLMSNGTKPTLSSAVTGRRSCRTPVPSQLRRWIASCWH